MSEQLTPHFSLDEFKCKCCGQVLESAARSLAARLEPVREDFGPVIIRSGYRCPTHNQAVGGAADSAHLIGLAADIRCPSDSDRFALLKSLLDHGFLRLGIGAGIIHADIAPRPFPVIWTYYPKH